MTSDQPPKPKNKGGRPRVDKPKEGSTIKAKSANWRLVIPNLQQYKDSSPQQLMQLKYHVLQKLLQRQKKYDLRYYHIALEHHANGVPHLDVLLIYAKSVRHNLSHFDYLLKHGNITTYRKLNLAILDYGKKEDKEALSNLPQSTVLPSGETVNQLIVVQDLKADPYRYLELQMLKDPLHFNLQQYVRKNDLAQYLSGWSSIKTKLKDMQLAAANLTLKEKPGFKFIDRELIQYNLNSDQLRLFDSWNGYQTIVNYLNQIITLGYRRPLKTMNLLITGPAHIGKTSLFQSDLNCSHNCVQRYTSVYPMGTRTWWPNYKPQVYRLIYWNEAKLTSYSYDTLLKVFQGSKVDLPYKGGSVLKYDNPLVLMTSNLTLDQMIQQKFAYNPKYTKLAKKNLAVRIQNVVVPNGLNLFLLQKLLVAV